MKFMGIFLYIVKGEEEIDEWASYFKSEVHPKIIITTNYRPTKKMYEFIKDLLKVFPNSYYYARKNYEVCFTFLGFCNRHRKASRLARVCLTMCGALTVKPLQAYQYYPSCHFLQLKKIIEYSNERGFTDILVVNEDRKIFNAMTHVHLPEGYVRIPQFYQRPASCLHLLFASRRCPKSVLMWSFTFNYHYLLGLLLIIN